MYRCRRGFAGLYPTRTFREGFGVGARKPSGSARPEGSGRFAQPQQYAAERTIDKEQRFGSGVAIAVLARALARGGADRAQHRGAAHRHERLQAGQRHPRARGRGPVVGRARRDDAPQRARRRPGRPARRRRVRGDPARHRPGRPRRRRRQADRGRDGAADPVSASRRCARRRASASRSRDPASAPPTSCCTAPTWPCVRRSGAPAAPAGSAGTAA
jgi:hypothetical protein